MSDRSETQIFAIRGVLMDYTNKRLTPDLIDEISGALEKEMKDSSVSWAFNPSNDWELEHWMESQEDDALRWIVLFHAGEDTPLLVARTKKRSLYSAGQTVWTHGFSGEDFTCEMIIEARSEDEARDIALARYPHVRARYFDWYSKAVNPGGQQE